MMRFLPLLLVLAACTQAPPPAPVVAAAPTTCAAHEPGFKALIGMTEAEVRSALAAMPGITTIRAGGPSAPMTMDMREDRATLAVSQSRVIRIACG